MINGELYMTVGVCLICAIIIAAVGIAIHTGGY